MKSNNSQPANRRGGRGGGRRYPKYNRGGRDSRSSKPTPAKKLSFWQKIIAFFTGKPRAKATGRPKLEQPRTASQSTSRKPESIDVSSPKVYVGNLSYDATEADLQELFNGVGQVQNAEIVTHRGGLRSKGFGFVTMLTVDEARRAVETLHDQDFMGRKLVVSGSKVTSERSYRPEGAEEAA